MNDEKLSKRYKELIVLADELAKEIPTKFKSGIGYSTLIAQTVNQFIAIEHNDLLQGINVSLLGVNSALCLNPVEKKVQWNQEINIPYKDDQQITC